MCGRHTYRLVLDDAHSQETFHCRSSDKAQPRPVALFWSSLEASIQVILAVLEFLRRYLLLNVIQFEPTVIFGSNERQNKSTVLIWETKLKPNHHRCDQC